VCVFTFAGSPPGDVEYPTAETVETIQALCVLPIERYIGPPGWRSMVGRARTVTVQLASPLGDRVLVDLDASPVIVRAHVS
jgi:hypothetical protein